MVLINSIGFFSPSRQAAAAARGGVHSAFSPTFGAVRGGGGMPHIGEPGAKLRRLCALFRELFDVGEL